VLTPAEPDQLAGLADLLGPVQPASPDAVLDAARAYTRTRGVQGTRGAEDFDRYVWAVWPQVLRRLVEAEFDLAALRSAVARHIAAGDRGDDPAPRELLDDVARSGIDLQDEVDAAAAVQDAEAHAAAFG
jgi:alkylation response protein AidB-like acyl-CoA dehydrogenase